MECNSTSCGLCRLEWHIVMAYKNFNDGGVDFNRKVDITGIAGIGSATTSHFLTKSNSSVFDAAKDLESVRMTGSFYYSWDSNHDYKTQLGKFTASGVSNGTKFNKVFTQNNTTASGHTFERNSDNTYSY